MRLKGKVILVTASTRGIGLAIVRACAKEGGIVCMAARDLTRAQEIADQLCAEGCRVHCVYNDATKPETFLSMVEETVKKAGRIDVLVNNFSCTVFMKTSGSVCAKSRSLPGLDVPKLFTSTSMRPAFVMVSSTIERKVSGLVASL